MNKTNNQKDRRSRPVSPPCETCGRTNHSRELLPWSKCSKEIASPEKTIGRTKPSPTEKCTKQLRWEWPSCSPNFKLATPRHHSGAACDRPETNEISKLPPIHELVWQQPTETITNQDNLTNTNSDPKKHYTQEKSSVASQTPPTKGTQPLNYVVTTEQPSGNQTGNEPVLFLHCSKNCSTDIQNTEQHVKTTLNGDTTNPPLTTATPLVEERLVRDEQTIEVYLPLTSTKVLKRKQEMLYVPLDFENNLTVYVLVDLGAFVSAIAEDDLDTIKTECPK